MTCLVSLDLGDLHLSGPLRPQASSCHEFAWLDTGPNFVALSFTLTRFFLLGCETLTVLPECGSGSYERNKNERCQSIPKNFGLLMETPTCRGHFQLFH